MCYTVVWDKAALETIKREVVDKSAVMNSNYSGWGGGSIKEVTCDPV